MGQFSWLDCITRKAIKDNTVKDVYVLVPKEFQDKFGKRIKENCYNGYGYFGGFDIYCLVAFWNRLHLSIDMLMPEPKLENFGGLYTHEKKILKEQGFSNSEIKQKDLETRKKYYKLAIDRRARIKALLDQYKNGDSDKKLAKEYGDDWQREIGIAIACYDEQNAKLPYPIKITYDATAIYEDCGPSDSDPNQGW